MHPAHTLACTHTHTHTQEADRKELDDLMKRRFFVVPSFEIYGGVAGFFDFGPPGSALKDQFLEFWKRHFVIYEDMLEITSACVTPHKVLETSGHVAKFADYMVKDVKEGNCFRADKLLEQHIDKLIESGKVSKEEQERLLTIAQNADAYSAKELGDKLKELGIKAPITGNALTDPFPFNLMFQTQIGPSGHSPGFLRPETAQSIFVNFKRLLDYNRERMPFAAAQIGLAFRNEIAPRAGLLRVREFLQAEIEHFVDPKDKDHVRFSEIKDNKAFLLPREKQVGKAECIHMSFGEAVEKKIIDNQTLAYFLARSQLFLEACGVNPLKLRFRQHLSNEMAHYAADCWDAEIFLRGYKWVEVAGHADRSAYDLKVHAKATKNTLEAQKALEKPIIEKIVEAAPVMKVMGKAFKRDAKVVKEHLSGLEKDDVLKLEESLKSGEAKIVAGGKEFTLLPEHVQIKKYDKKISTESFIPNVIEPSFGVGRIIYSILDNAFTYVGEGKDRRTILKLPAVIAPIKAGIFCVVSSDELQAIAESIRKGLVEEGLMCQFDRSTTTIGRKYAKSDEIGIPYGISIDNDSKSDNKVTIRDRDSWKQIRVPIEDVPDIIRNLCRLKISFAKCLEKYGEFKQ
eukprot:jgi/Bigna1/53322/estExt_Genewise1Plus.C_180034